MEMTAWLQHSTVCQPLHKIDLLYSGQFSVVKSLEPVGRWTETF